MPAQAIDRLDGRNFGSLTVLYRELNRSKKQTWWRCRCVCGTETVVRGDKLRLGKTLSCGAHCHRGMNAGIGRKSLAK